MSQKQIGDESPKAGEKSEEEVMKGFLEGIGFSEGKEGCFVKEVEVNGTKYKMYWDLRKEVPFFYVYRNGEDKALPKKDLGMFEENKLFADKFNIKQKEKKTAPATGTEPVNANPTDAITLSPEQQLRGTEGKVDRLIDTKLHLDSIIDATEKNKEPGEGILFHILKFGKGDGETVHKEPSVELVDMIAQDMGHITTEIKEFDINNLEDPNTHKKYLTYYCVVQATDGITHTSGLGAAEQIIDFNEMERNGRTFARTNAIRKAERNAKERLIPIPRKALVELVIRKLNEHDKKRKK